ncbi:MAG: SoxR reducing system RseC family protein [Planctomycetota bacterium]
MKYVEEKGTVVSVDDGVATIRLDQKVTESCGSCCACSAYESGKDTIEVNADGLAKGERVQARIPRVNPYLSMFLVFGLPLALFMTGIAVGQQIQGGERLGGTSALGGVLGLIVAVLVASSMNHLLTRKAHPTAHKIDDAENNPE